MATTQAKLAEEILAANRAISSAEIELRDIVGNIEIAPRAQKVKVSDIVRVAFLKLEAARARLLEVEKSESAVQLEAARMAIIEVEANLEVAVDGIVCSAGLDGEFVTGVFNDTIEKIRAAKERIIDLRLLASEESDNEG